jgi:hypothetical protein
VNENTNTHRDQHDYSEGEKAILARFAARARKLRADINHVFETGMFFVL